MITLLTPKRLISYLIRNYGYNITESKAQIILSRCEQEFEDEFSEEELISVVEDCLN